MNRTSPSIKLIAIISIILLLGALLPLSILGHYNHALGDDFEYGVYAKTAMDEGSIFSAIAAAAKGTALQYEVWQGTYSAMFLMHLPPQIFGDFFYKLYPSIILLSLAFGVFYMVKPLVCTYFNRPIENWLIICSLITLLFIEQVPLMGEAFYWYNGSMYYTGFYAFTLFFWGMTFRFLISPQNIYIVLLSLFGLFMAGGNYASLLPTIIMLLCILAFLCIKKKPSKSIVGLLIVICFIIAGFTVSILAPGNVARQSTSFGTTPIKAIVKSLWQGFNYLKGWSNIWLFLALALLTPLFLSIINESSFSFKHPLIVLILGFGIFSSASCPTFYAQNNGGAARVFDLSWYNMVLLVIGSYFYLLGWYIRQINRETLLVGICFIALVFVFMLLLRPISDTYIQLNSIHAIHSIQSGDAEYYEQQYRKRLEQINSDELNLVFKPYDVPESLMYVIHLGDLGPDPDIAVNKAFSEFYHKESVIVK